MPLPSLTVNGQDLESLGLRVEDIDGPWDLPDTSDPTIVVPGRNGAARTGGQTTTQPRTITIGAKIIRAQALNTLIDQLKLLFSLGILEVTFADLPTRVYQVRTPTFKTRKIGGAIVATSAEFTITLTCADPIAYNLNPTCVSFGTTPVMCPVGTAPSGGLVLRIMAPFTNTTVIVRAASGEPVHTIGITRAGTADLDYEEIDIDLSKLTRSQSGSKTSDNNALTSGDFEAFSISPEEGDSTLGVGPTIECTGVSGDGACELTYYVGWL